MNNDGNRFFGSAPRNLRRLSVISEEKTLRSGQGSFEENERVGGGLSPDGFSPDGFSPPGDFKARVKESTASVVSSGMDRTQSPSEDPDMRTPTRPGNPPCRNFISTPKNERECPDFRLPCPDLSAINATVNITTGSETTMGAFNKRLKTLGSQASAEEVLAAVEKLRLENKEHADKKKLQLRSFRTPADPPKKTPQQQIPLFGKAIQKETTVSKSSTPNASATPSSVPLVTPTHTTTSANRTFPFGDSDLGIGSRILSFGCVENRATSFRGFPVKNISDKPLRLQLHLRNKNSDFKILDGAVRSLNPGEEQTVRVQFAPSKTVASKNTLVLENSADKRRYTVALLGFGGLADLSIPLTPHIQESRYGIYFMGMTNYDFIRFSVKSAGSRSMFCKVILKAGDETLSVPINHERFVLKPREHKNIEINISGLNVCDHERTVILLWDAEVLRQRMAAYLKQPGKTSPDPMTAYFTEEFCGAEPHIDDFPLSRADLTTFQLAVNRTIICLRTQNEWENPGPSTEMSTQSEQTWVRDEEETTMNIRN